jgi:2'-5' RNA ligase
VIYYSASEGAEDLKALAVSLDMELHRELEIERERRPFKSHITVARIKNPLSASISLKLGEVPPLRGLSQTVAGIHLMQSELRRSGAEYTAVKEIALGAAT